MTAQQAPTPTRGELEDQVKARFTVALRLDGRWIVLRRGTPYVEHYHARGITDYGCSMSANGCRPRSFRGKRCAARYMRRLVRVETAEVLSTYFYAGKHR